MEIGSLVNLGGSIEKAVGRALAQQTNFIANQVAAWRAAGITPNTPPAPDAASARGARAMSFASFGNTSSLGGGGGTDWTGALIGGANVIGAYFDRRSQRRSQNRLARAQIRAQQGGGVMPYANNPFMNVNPNLGGTAGNPTTLSLTPGGFGANVPSDPYGLGGLASWQTSPIDGGGIFAGGGADGMTQASMLPTIVGAAGAAAVRGIPALARSLMKYLAPAAAIALAEQMVFDGATVGGPYRTEAANKALAYRGDLAACKRLRKLGSAIGYAKGTGVRRSGGRFRRR